MSDDDASLVDPKDHVERETYRETLLYDYAKFLTTLSLLALGGVLTITQSAPSGSIKAGNIAMVVGLMAAGGVCSLSAVTSLAQARLNRREPSKWLPAYVKGAMAFLGMGLGAFLTMWTKTLT